MTTEAPEGHKAGETMKAYRWQVTKDHITQEGDPWPNARGTRGPRDCSDTMANPSRWAAYDADGECYYEGMIYGEYDGFEPLDEFAGPNAGAIGIRINGVEI